jgi:hypothetical protein
MTDTVDICTHNPSEYSRETCTVCDAPAVMTITLTPDAFASRSCHFCGGERSFCAGHWNEFVAEITRAAAEGANT